MRANQPNYRYNLQTASPWMSIKYPLFWACGCTLQQWASVFAANGIMIWMNAGKKYLGLVASAISRVCICFDLNHSCSFRKFKHGSSGSMLMLIDVRLTRSKKDGGRKAAYLQGSQVMQVDEGHAGGWRKSSIPEECPHCFCIRSEQFNSYCRWLPSSFWSQNRLDTIWSQCRVDIWEREVWAQASDQVGKWQAR